MSMVASAGQFLEVTKVLPVFFEPVIEEQEQLHSMLYLDLHWDSPAAQHAYPLSTSIDLVPGSGSCHLQGCSSVSLICYSIAVRIIIIRALHSF